MNDYEIESLKIILSTIEEFNLNKELPFPKLLEFNDCILALILYVKSELFVVIYFGSKWIK